MNFFVFLVVFSSVAYAQLTQDELEPLFAGLRQGPISTLGKRVPLMTDDPTISPLVDLQVFAPPVVPLGGTNCEIELMRHSFGDGSYDTPNLVNYTPPTDKNCGEVGQWAAISMNLSVYSIGTQYDRFGAIFLGHSEIWRTSSAEPTKTGTTWTTIKDVTHFAPLFAEENDLMMDFSNIISDEFLLDGVFDVVITATFYAPTRNFPTPRTSDAIIPLSNLSPNTSNIFTTDNDDGATVNVTIPQTTEEVYIEVFASGNSAEEFWYLNTPDDYVSSFPESTGLIGKGPFREVQVLIDNQLAGVVWPYAVFYTGGVTPTNWRPLTSYGAYDAPSYWIDATPFIPILVDGQSHSITMRVRGQGTNPSINSNWFLSGSMHIRTGQEPVSGEMKVYEVPDLEISTGGHVAEDNSTVSTTVKASRRLHIESVLKTAKGEKTVTFTQRLEYSNEAAYADEGWVQWANQSTIGSVESVHDGKKVLRDAFSYPINLFSNYSLYDWDLGGYGSDIYQNYTRFLLTPPLGTYQTVHSDQHAQGWVGMDDWPGLRHAINGTGETAQLFAYVDGHHETYFRDVATKNDGWVRDNVWGTLREQNPPVPPEQIYGPGGGPGFRRDLLY